MTEAPSRSIRLFGTDQPVAPPRVLSAGPLTAELEAGNLRYIRLSGVEMIRAISFIVRDKNWGTYDPAIGDLVVEEAEDSFRVAYSAVARDAAQSFAYEAEITGSADGSLRFAAKGRARYRFPHQPHGLRRPSPRRRRRQGRLGHGDDRPHLRHARSPT